MEENLNRTLRSLQNPFRQIQFENKRSVSVKQMLTTQKRKTAAYDHCLPGRGAHISQNHDSTTNN